jgi:hypothetical protein
MSNSYESSRPVDQMGPAPPKSGCGCWVWGCLTVVLLGIIGTGVAGFFSYQYLGAQVAKYTSETPQELPVIEYEPEAMAALETRFEGFKTNLKDGGEVEDLILTADDINAMISNNPDLKGKVFVKIEEGQITGDVSIPTDNVPLAGGRFFNASAAFDVSMENGILIVTLADAEVKGEKVPDQVLDVMRKENLAKNLYDDAETAKAFRRIESLVVEDGKVVLKVRKEEAGAESKSETSRESDASDEAEPAATAPLGEVGLPGPGEGQF